MFWVIGSFMDIKNSHIHICAKSKFTLSKNQFYLVHIYWYRCMVYAHVSGWCLKEGFIWPPNVQLCLHNCCYQSHSQSVNLLWHCLRQGGKWSGVIHSAVSVSQSVDCTHQKTHTNVCGIIHEEWQLESFIDWTLLTLSGITLY